MDYQLHDKGVNNLVFAIVMSAVKDYFSNNEEIKQDAISFLNSDMFIILTNGKIDTDVLMDKLQKIEALRLLYARKPFCNTLPITKAGSC